MEDRGVAFTLTNLPRSVLGVSGKSVVFAVGAEGRLTTAGAVSITKRTQKGQARLGSPTRSDHPAARPIPRASSPTYAWAFGPWAVSPAGRSRSSAVKPAIKPLSRL